MDLLFGPAFAQVHIPDDRVLGALVLEESSGSDGFGVPHTPKRADLSIGPAILWANSFRKSYSDKTFRPIQ